MLAPIFHPHHYIDALHDELVDEMAGISPFEPGLMGKRRADLKAFVELVEEVRLAAG